ncbi:MAG: sugar ABC transporter permease [Chloroflexi bacterium]|nr:MAG: sugar ABC transporter permease [Chloroflexota bacterium]
MPAPSKPTATSTVTSDDRPVASALSRWTSLSRVVRREAAIGWLFVLPALLMYALFVLLPLLLSIQYSFLRWDGIGPMTWVGLKNYATVLDDPDLLGTIFNAFKLVIFFSFIPVTLGLVVASVIHRVATGRLGAIARTVLFLPQVIPLVAAGIIWGWLLALPGLINQILRAVGLETFARAWLGDFDWALPAVGLIGVWVLLGFCTVLLLTGITKIDPSLYESARIDGAGWFTEFVNITIPLLKQEIGVCLTVTVIAALAAFDIVYVSTAGGPGNSTAVPGIQIYILAFTEQRIGLASALAVMLMVLVLVVILPIQYLSRESTP